MGEISSPSSSATTSTTTTGTVTPGTPADTSRASEINKKSQELRSIIIQDNRDEMKRLATTKYGLINTETRYRIWPKLLGCHLADEEIAGQRTESDSVPIEFLSPHRDESQVDKDVLRSYIHYPVNMSSEKETELKQSLRHLIVWILREVPQLNYYQGYHDIAAVVTLVFQQNELVAFKFLYKLTLGYLRDHMLQDIDPTTRQLDMIPELVYLLDPELGKVVKSVSSTFSLSAIISLFAHELDRFEDVCLIWDAILASRDSSFPIYLYSSMLVYFKPQILKQLGDLDAFQGSSKDSRFDKEVVYVVLSRAISKNINSLDPETSQDCITEMVQLAMKSEKKYPLGSLVSIRKISRYSCLKRRKPSTTVLDLQYKEEAKLLNQRLKRERISRRLKRISSTGFALVSRLSKMSVLSKTSLGIGMFTIALAIMSRDPNTLDRLKQLLGSITTKSQRITNHMLRSIRN